jgi:hypothetical protein
MSFVEVRNLRLGYREEGSGTPIVFFTVSVPIRLCGRAAKTLFKSGAPSRSIIRATANPNLRRMI